MDRFVPITDIYAREILDARGNAVLETEVLAGEHTVGRTCIPAGTSAGEGRARRYGAGKYEAGEPRDGGHCYEDPGVERLAELVNAKIAPELTGRNVLEQRKLDEALCSLCGAGDQSVERTGAGVPAGVSMSISAAAARAAAAVTGLPLYAYLGGVNSVRLPTPVVSVISNTINSGSAAGLRGFMLLPAGARCFREGLRLCTEVYHAMGKLLWERGHSTAVADDGSFAPALSGAEEALSLLNEAAWRAGYCPGRDLAFALDGAASELYDPERKAYVFRGGSRDCACPVTRTAEEMIDEYAELAGRYPVISIEDGLAPEDQEGWKKLNARMGQEVQLAGCGLFTADGGELREGIRRYGANAVRIKISQAGTLSGLFDAIRLAQQNDFRTILSRSSDETADPVIADIAVAGGVSQIKAGAPCRAEQVEKYNRLLRIGEQLGDAGALPSR